MSLLHACTSSARTDRRIADYLDAITTDDLALAGFGFVSAATRRDEIAAVDPWEALRMDQEMAERLDEERALADHDARWGEGQSCDTLAYGLFGCPVCNPYYWSDLKWQEREQERIDHDTDHVLACADGCESCAAWSADYYAARVLGAQIGLWRAVAYWLAGGHYAANWAEARYAAALGEQAGLEFLLAGDLGYCY